VNCLQEPGMAGNFIRSRSDRLVDLLQHGSRYAKRHRYGGLFRCASF
jgi:hypothetical protein